MSSRYEFAVKIVKDAGERALIFRDKALEVSIKNDDPRDIVTNADKELSVFISEEINRSFSGETVYSEESDTDISKGSYWSIDPIDGTAAFSRGMPHFSIVIAYVEDGIPKVGVVYNPITKELFSFEKGKGAFLNNRRVKVSQIKDISQSYVFFRAGRKSKLWDWGVKVYRFLLENANKTFNFGSSALDICFVGAGRIEACIYGNLTPLDIIAAIGFVHEAGGLVVGRGGVEIVGVSKEKQILVAANSREIIQALREGTEL